MTTRSGARIRPELLVFLLLASLSTALLLRAWLDPPRGTAFVGTFAYPDDFYNYLSMAEQAQRGVLLFKSKMTAPDLPAGLVNLEWLLVGWLGAALGGHLVLAYRLLGIAALGTAVWAAGRWLAGCGVPADRQLAGLLLVFTGGGLGGLAFAFGLIPGAAAFDLRLGAYPFVEALGNPHFMVGTALLASSLSAFAVGRTGMGAALGAVLGLARPYDAVLLGASEAGSVLLSTPPRRWPRRLAPLLVLAPPLAYNQWVFRSNPGFRTWVSPRYGETVLGPGDWLLLLGPAAVIALAGLRPAAGRADAGERSHLTRLRLWVAAAWSIALLRPVVFSNQFVVGIGFPLLLLAAAALARWRRGLAIATLPMAASSLVYAWLCATPNIDTHPPAERLRVAAAVRPLCRPGDVVLSPDDIGLYVGGRTPCWPYVSHAAAADYDLRLDAVRRFYAPGSPPSERAALLDEGCIAHVILPAGPDAAWLGDPSYRPRSLVSGPNGRFVVWSREPPRACRR